MRLDKILLSSDLKITKETYVVMMQQVSFGITQPTTIQFNLQRNEI